MTSSRSRPQAQADSDRDEPTGHPRSSVISNRWESLRRHTPARIALGRSGVGVPTSAHLAFQMAHAQARDSVHRALDAAAIEQGIEALGLATVRVHSAAGDRSVYLQRPDLGRRLDDESRRRLRALGAERKTGLAITESVGHPPAAACDFAFVVADGLSALAVERHATPLLSHAIPLLGHLQTQAPWTIAPVAIVEQGRVAIGDEIGEMLGARLVVVLIGERPGLSSPDSLGIYVTWGPRPGRSDAERNCISNVRPEGLGTAEAARRLCHLLAAAQRRQLTGVALKDESDAPEGALVELRENFLLAGAERDVGAGEGGGESAGSRTAPSSDSEAGG